MISEETIRKARDFWNRHPIIHRTVIIFLTPVLFVLIIYESTDIRFSFSKRIFYKQIKSWISTIKNGVK